MQEWQIKEYTRNVHKIIFEISQKEVKKVCLMSDLHWDNPSCKLKLLTKHLDFCLSENIPVIVAGDFFCAMQGKYDKRSNKDDLREEHKTENYLDALVETAADWFQPYAPILTIMGYGNHETSISKRHETDLIQRFVQLIKSRNSDSPIKVGGYSGWVKFSFLKTGGGHVDKKNLYYHHGAGGGGPVTRGVIQTNRQAVYIRDADIVHNGHTHDSWIVPISTIGLNSANTVEHARMLFIRTPGYKEEFNDGHKGFHVEKWAPPKPVGSCLLTFSYERCPHRESMKTYCDAKEMWH